MDKDNRTLLECPHCKHRITMMEFKLARFDYECGCTMFNISEYELIKGTIQIDG